MKTSTIQDNIKHVQDTIADSCAHAGRDVDSVTLVAVSKKKPAADVVAAVEAGLQHFGENRVEESQVKIPEVTAQVDLPLTWHMIGHIQSRKAREIPQLFQIVHSLDSLKLAEKLSRLAVEMDHPLDVLLEVNVSGEDAKYGFSMSGWEQNAAIRESFWQEFTTMKALPGLNMRGLMTMAPIVDTMEETRPVFASLANLRDALVSDFDISLPDLSMGMTDDYPVAIEEGATIVRVGRAIFGERSV